MHTLTPLFAVVAGWHDGDHGHWWIVFPILWLTLIALAILFLWRRCRHPRDGDPARRILGERFARGEISADEYRARLAQLQ
jgi:putative membrane protein